MKTKRLLRIVLLLGIIGFSIGMGVLYKYYRTFIGANTLIIKEARIYIPTFSNFEDVKKVLMSSKVLRDFKSFERVADYYGYTKAIKPGSYVIKPGMSNRAIVAMLKAGHQKPVRVTFTGMRSWHQLAGRISNQIEADSVTLLNFFLSDTVAANRGFSQQTFMVMFIPNTYEFYWNTNAIGFINRMQKEYRRFWNEQRAMKARNLSLTWVEVSILASIVEEETNVTDEMPIIAGVYLNRLSKGMPLQADPTVKFAVGYFSLRRILTRHLMVDSPYNTYKYRGLPPGPIRIPSTRAIDAVLNSQKHSYLYFCASSDFSGRHVFAKTLSEHNRNAEAYRRALNKEKIYR